MPSKFEIHIHSFPKNGNHEQYRKIAQWVRQQGRLSNLIDNLRKTIMSAPAKESKKTVTAESIHARISRLEAENRELREQLEQSKSDNECLSRIYNLPLQTEKGRSFRDLFFVYVEAGVSIDEALLQVKDMLK